MLRCRRKLSVCLIAAAFCSGCCSGTNPCQDTRIGPSTGEVVAAAVGIVAVVGIGTAVLVHVERTHHYVKGCLFNGPSGLEIQDSGSKKNYIVAGSTPDLKVGDMVRLHGAREKKVKGSPDDPKFVVQKLQKSYGTCTIAPAAPQAPSRQP